LVAKQQRSSAIVVETALDDYHELFQVRALIERLAIRRIAKTISPVQCRELEGLIGLMRQAAGRRDLLSLSLSDMEFHRRPCEWSGNTGLLRAWLPLSVQVLRFLTQYEIQDYETPNQIAEEHEGLLVDLCSHDVERAETAWSAHVLGSFRQLEDVQARQKPRASVLADVQV
jgi:DNA-binding GntR family transcriptional regulator